MSIIMKAMKMSTGMIINMDTIISTSMVMTMSITTTMWMKMG